MPSSQDIPKCELHPAHVWDCPECGVENFCRCVVPELPEDEENEIKQSLGYEQWEEGCLVTAPDVVVCKECGRQFSTAMMDEDNEETE